MCDSAIFHTFAADNSVKFDVFFNPILLWTHGDTALFWNCLIALLTLQLIESPFLLRPKPCTRECEISYRGIQKPFSGEAVGVLKIVFFCPQDKRLFRPHCSAELPKSECHEVHCKQKALPWVFPKWLQKWEEYCMAVSEPLSAGRECIGWVRLRPHLPPPTLTLTLMMIYPWQFLPSSPPTQFSMMAMCESCFLIFSEGYRRHIWCLQTCIWEVL